MSFKNLKEVYQALMDGKSIICEASGTVIKMVNDDKISVTNNRGVISIIGLGETTITMLARGKSTRSQKRGLELHLLGR